MAKQSNNNEIVVDDITTDTSELEGKVLTEDEELQAEAAKKLLVETTIAKVKVSRKVPSKMADIPDWASKKSGIIRGGLVHAQQDRNF